jgi:murein DD-endopeptidase MepM/ murein hydrolase activator NlpD
MRIINIASNFTAKLAGAILMMTMASSVLGLPDYSKLPQSAPVPGGIVSLKLPHSLNSRPIVSFNKRSVAVVRHSDSWYAIVGLPLSIKPGPHSLSVGNQPISFQVTDKKYPEQRITLKTRKHIDLSKEDLARHRGEKAKAKKVFKGFDQQRTPDFAMLKPVEGPYSSPFGLKRFFNDEPRNPHSGLDIAAPTGTPIKAPSEGTVKLTGNFFFNGNVVYMDHGQGVISMFCHLSQIDVKEGDVLSKGDILGKVGATGRVTGPHLHWSLSLNNNRVDPMLMLEK